MKAVCAPPGSGRNLRHRAASRLLNHREVEEMINAIRQIRELAKMRKRAL